MMPAEARALMHEWTQSPSLRTHMECVAACMGAYARLLDASDEDRWIVAGLLHDFDYERHPTKEEHPFVGVRHLESLGVDADIREAILGHAEYSGVPRRSPMARALFAVDELAGFLVACARVRPDGFAGLEPKSVRKKLKDKAFAAAVNRDDVRIGFEELLPLLPEGFDESAHFQTCVEAIRTRVPEFSASPA
ncbi:MAG: hypothetical protein AMXMBFR77_11020 [Phycisphaerales bacterium]|nr:HDIG domain-containing protein [Phycisphaerales bacterium]GIK18314.1 MAG: HDIG domain-containing protein [Planctomycetota bacterium]